MQITTTAETPMMLVTTGHGTLFEHVDPLEPTMVHPHLGRLIQPRHYGRIEETAAAGLKWGADNDCFNGLDARAFQMMLDRITGVSDGCEFVAVPDVLRCLYCDRTKDGYGGGAACTCTFSKGRPPLVYGDAGLTMLRFREWETRVRATGCPLALVLQDGQDEVPVPWDDIDAVFVGGSDDFKLGEIAAELVREAKARGKWVHWGRVNAKARIDYCASTGACDSLDGSSWAKFRMAVVRRDGTRKLDLGLQWCRDAARPQLALA